MINATGTKAILRTLAERTSRSWPLPVNGSDDQRLAGGGVRPAEKPGGGISPLGRWAKRHPTYLSTWSGLGALAALGMSKMMKRGA
jgi:hypothetical protein